MDDELVNALRTAGCRGRPDWASDDSAIDAALGVAERILYAAQPYVKYGWEIPASVWPATGPVSDDDDDMSD